MPLRLRSLALLALAAMCIGLVDTMFAAASSGNGTASAIRRVRTGKPVEIYDAGEALRWRVTVVNPSGDSPLEGRLAWSVTPWRAEGDGRGPSSSGALPVSLPPGENTVVVLDHTPGLLGWHEIALEFRDAGGVLIDRQVRTLSVGSTPRGDGRHFRYGICSHLRRHIGTPLFDTEVALAGRLGVDALRTELAGWESTEPEEGKPDWTAADRVLAALEPLGIEIQPIFAYSTRWASTGDPAAADWNDWNKAAPRLAPWLTHVRAVLERYGDRARYWEIWNEPDISFWRSSTESYIELFDATAPLIKKTVPGAFVLNGGFAMIRRPPNTDFVEKFTASADHANWDVFAYHDYHTFAQFLARRDEVTAHLAALRPGMPLWINEGGHHALLEGGEREQALTLVKKLATSPALGVSAYFWYNLRDDGLDPRDPEHHFGLAHYDGRPKPAWSAYQNLIRELGSARYHGSLPAADIPAGVWAHLYERAVTPGDDASHVLVLWQEGSTRRVPVWLGADSGARVTRVLDLMGNPVSASIAEKGAVLDLSREPLYVHLKLGPTLPRLVVRTVLDTPPLVVLVPDAVSPLRLGVHNPLPVPVTARLRLASDVPGLALPSDLPPISLLAGETTQRTLDLRLAAAASSSFDRGERPSLELRLAIPEAGLELPARIPAVLAKPIPRLAPGAALDGLPVFVRLERQADVFNLYSAEPLPAMQWRGPADLSAAARLANDGDALHLEVVVIDDIHHQTDLGADLWSGDSLQVGIRLAETDAGYIELGLALDNEGRTGGWVFANTPAAELPLGRLDSSVGRSVTRDAATATTTYRLRLPWKTLGVPAARPPADSFRLTFIVNDHDGRGRKQWVKLSDGLGDQKTPALWPVFVCP